jgi:hypothetical protein
VRRQPHDVESMRRSLAIGGELTHRDLEELVGCCGELLAERVRIERLLMSLRPAAGRTSREIYELCRAVGITPAEPGQRRR